MRFMVSDFRGFSNSKKRYGAPVGSRNSHPQALPLRLKRNLRPFLTGSENIFCAK